MPGSYTVQASKSDYVTKSSTIDVDEGSDAEVNIILESVPSIAEVRVMVKDGDGATLSGASVSSTSQPSGQSVLSGTSGTDGVAYFEVLSGGYTFQASKTGFITKSTQINVVVGEVNNLTIILEAQAPEGGGGIPGFPIFGLVLGGLLVQLWLYSSRKSQ